MGSKFTPPDFFGDLPQLTQDILRETFSEIADQLSTNIVSSQVETVEAILTPGAPVRVSPTSAGMNVILPAPNGNNAGLTFSVLIEDPKGPVVIVALPHLDAGGKQKSTKVNGADTATFTTDGQVTFISNGIDRYVSQTEVSAESSTGAAPPLPGTTFAANTTPTAGVPDNLTVTSDNTAVARIAGRLKQVAAGASEVFRRSTTNELSFGLIDTDNLEDDSIETAKILDSNVTEPKLATDSVSNVKVQDEAITIPKQAHVAEHTTRGRFVSGTGDLQDKAITSFYSTGFLYNTGLGELSVDFSSVTYTADESTLTLTGLEFSVLADGITNNELGPNSVNSANIQDGTVTNTDLVTVAANTIKSNPTAGIATVQDLAVGTNSFAARVGGNLVSHPFSTFAGTGLDYAAGVLSVDFSSVTYTAALPIQLAGNQFSLIDMGPGRLLGNQIDGVIGAPVNISSLEVGELIRRSTRQVVTLTAPGTYTSADIVVFAETTHLVIDSTGSGLIQIAGLGFESLVDGQQIEVFLGNFTDAQLAFLSESGLDAEVNRIQMPGISTGALLRLTDTNEVATLIYRRGTEFSSLRWCLVGALSAWLLNDTSQLTNLDAPMHNGTEVVWRRITGSDLVDGSVGETQLADGGVTLAKRADMGPGVVGKQIDAATGTPVVLSPQELGEMVHVNTRQNISLTPSGGTGTGNEYIAADWVGGLAIALNTTEISINLTAPGEVIIAGLPVLASGRRLTFVFDDGNNSLDTTRVVFQGNSGQEANENRLFTPFIRRSASNGGADIYSAPVLSNIWDAISFRLRDAGSSSSDRWQVDYRNSQQLAQHNDLAAGELAIVDANGTPTWRTLEASDLDLTAFYGWTGLHRFTGTQLDMVGSKIEFGISTSDFIQFGSESGQPTTGDLRGNGDISIQAADRILLGSGTDGTGSTNSVTIENGLFEIAETDGGPAIVVTGNGAYIAQTDTTGSVPSYKDDDDLIKPIRTNAAIGWTPAVIHDEFLSRQIVNLTATTDVLLADTNWGLEADTNGKSYAGGSIEVGHPGQFEITTAGVAANDFVRMFKGLVRNSAMFLFQDFKSMTWVVRSQITTNVLWRVGITTDGTLSVSQGAFFELDTDNDATIRCVTRNATVQTTTDLNITSTNYLTLRIEQATVGTWTFYLDGALVATHSGSVPVDTTSANVQLVVAQRSTTTARSIKIDAFAMEYRALSRS